MLLRLLSLCQPDFDRLLGVLDGDVVLAKLVDPLEVGEVQLDEFFRLIPGYTKEGITGLSRQTTTLSQGFSLFPGNFSNCK